MRRWVRPLSKYRTFSKPRMYAAFAIYAFLAVVAALTLDAPYPVLVGGYIIQRPLRMMVWILLAGLALRTWLAKIREERESQNENRNDPALGPDVSER